MQHGDILTDSRGSAWIVDGSLGRGLWGRVFALKGEDGSLAVLKAPLARSDFARSADPDALAAACASVAAATRAVYEERSWPFLPRLLGTVRLPDGREGLVLPRFDASLATRIAGGVPLSDALDLVVRVLHQLTTARAGGAVHGNLRPANLFSDASGNPVLTDPAVPALEPHRRLLEAAAPERASWMPPEGASTPNGGWDTWALCLALWRASASPTAAEDPTARKGAVPEEGVGRVAIAAIKDAAAARLKAEGANKRFAPRAVAKLGAVLNRGLSPEHEPSPPYRFARSGELLERLVEVDELLHPRIESVSKVLLGASAKDGVFEGIDKIAFSVHVGATAGVTAQDDIAVGLQLLDLDAQGDGRVRVDGSRFTVNRYPSGKWRFEFELPDVPPGRYRIKVAFRVKDEGGEPCVAEGGFEQRPRPGWVPPAPEREDTPAAIPFPGSGGFASSVPPSFVDAEGSFEGRTSPGEEEERARRMAPPRPIRPLRAVSDLDDVGHEETPHTTPPRSEPVAVPFVPPSVASPIRPVAVMPEPRTSAPPPRPALGAPHGGPYGFDPPTSPSRPGIDLRAPVPGPSPRPVAAPPPRPSAPSLRTLSPASISLDPPTSPSLPTVATEFDLPPDAFADPFLQDYPPPPPTGGSDLPTYDLGSGSAGHAALGGLRDRLVSWSGGELWNIGIALVAASLVIGLLVFQLVKTVVQ